MPDRGHNSFSPQLLLLMQNLPTSNATNLPSSCDEELADEADEPPDGFQSASDGEFAKHAIQQHQSNSVSLLTRALLVGSNAAPADRFHSIGLKRGMSIDSTWSNSSAMELTSDGGMTSPSRASSPSPPPPPSFLGGLAGLLRGKKEVLEPQRVEIAGERDDPVEGLGRRRCITFACQDRPASVRRPSCTEKVAPSLKQEPSPQTPPRRACALKFVCTQRGNSSDCPSSPSQSAIESRRLPGARGRRDSQATVVETTPRASRTIPPSIPTDCSAFPDKFYEFASSVDDNSDSWTNQPIDKSRMLRVDDLLKKELDIRRLGEEAEEEALQEEEEEQDLEDADLDGDDAGDGEEEDEDEEDEDEEDEEDYEEEDEYDALSGNESDNEEGFASDSDDDDDPLFTYGPMLPITRPICCRSESTSSIESMRGRQTRPPRRPRTPDLPDSTDFVCGTLDEDKPLEEAYVSCMEERKRSKHVITPQDIDPSFPSDPENSDDEGSKHVSESEDGFHFVKANWSGSSMEGNRSRRLRKRDASKKKTLTGSPKPRPHSPAPIRRSHTSPRPVARRPISPPPFNRTKHRSQMLQPRPNIFRTKSLPRTPGFFGRTGGACKISSSPKMHAAVSPVIVRRGAIDIVKGLEKRRERRKARLSKKEGVVDCRAGQGVEKMRELGLEICGKGKGRARPQWVLSA